MSDGAHAAPKTRVDTPSITCDPAAATQTSVDVKVCAPGGTGATGSPAGFSLQWLTATDFANGGFPENCDTLTPDPNCTKLCKGSFSGNANLSRYNLLPGQCATIRVGDILLDEGASTNCPDVLTCDTDYVFRAFAHATSTLMRSNFTADLTCRTSPCGSTGQCTYTQGFWKTHGPAGVWPQSVLDSGLKLGTVTYTADQLVAILNQSVGGNGLIALAHQLIAAKLNIAEGAYGSAVAQAIVDADTLIGALVVPPVGSGFLAPRDTSTLTTTLDTYNSGGTGPGHCSDETSTG